MGGAYVEEIGTLLAEILTSWWTTKREDKPTDIPFPPVCVPLDPNNMRVNVALKDGRTLKARFLAGTFSYQTVRNS